MPNPGDIIIPFDPEKKIAVEQFSGPGDPPIVEELTAAANKIYQKRVPESVQLYIEKRPVPPPKPPKPRKSPPKKEAEV